jgi:hypothetical protein
MSTMNWSDLRIAYVYGVYVVYGGYVCMATSYDH